MKKLISVLLTVLMLLTVAVPCTFAVQENQTSYLLLGDSIAAGLGLDNPDKGSYGAIVAYSNGYSYKNDAVSGHTSNQLIKRLGKAEIQDDVRNADIISLSIGGNDFLMDNMIKLILEAQKGNYSRFEKIADNYYVNLCTIIETIKELNPNVVVLLQNLYNPRTDSLRDLYQNGINILNSRIERFASENIGNGIYFVDVASYTKDLGSDYFQNDQVHPNAEGHVVLAQAVIDVLYANGLGTAQIPTSEEPGVTHVGFLTYLKRVIEFLKEIINKISSIICKH